MLWRLTGAALSGLFLGISFPYPGWAPLAGVALIPLILSMRGQGIGRRMVLGAVMGIIFFAWLMPWLRFVHPLALGGILLYAALWYGLTAALAGRLESPLTVTLWFPLVWTGLEYLRSIGTLGFAWGLLGHTQYRFLPMIQIASIGGVTAVSLLLCMVNGSLVALPGSLSRREWRRAALLLIPMLAVTLNIAIGARRAPEWAAMPVERTRVALVQTHFGQYEKWDRSTLRNLVRTTLDLVDRALETKPDMVALPETVFPVVLADHPEILTPLRTRIDESGIPILVGYVTEPPPPYTDRYCNAVTLWHPGGETFPKDSAYRKMHLVPWGEYVPFERWIPFVGRVVSEAGGGLMAPGTRRVLFSIQGNRFGVPICFESTVAGEVAAFVRMGAGFLVNASNDAWFLQSSAQEQHALQSVFRAVENRRAVIRPTNMGKTCLILPSGEIADSLPMYQTGVLTVEVPVRTEQTFFNRYGDLPGKAILGIVLALLAGEAWKRYRIRKV